MPITLFWLTPVFLLIVVILLILQEQQKEKERVFLIDPFIVLESLRIARIIGDEKGIAQELAAVRRILPNSNDHIEQALRLLTPIISSTPAKIHLLQHRLHNEFLHEYRYEHAGRVSSVLVGSLDEVKQLSQDFHGAEQLRVDQERAEQSGFMSLVIARRIDTKLIEGRQSYRILGMILAEAELNEPRVSKVRYATSSKKKIILSWLPQGMSNLIAEKLFPATTQLSASAAVTRRLLPKERQNVLERTTVYADTTLNDRYEAVQLWKHQARLLYIGMGDQDRDHLPCEHVAL